MSIERTAEILRSDIAEVTKVYTASIAAIGISYTGIVETLKLILLILTIAYTAVKLWKVVKGRKTEED